MMKTIVERLRSRGACSLWVRRSGSVWRAWLASGDRHRPWENRGDSTVVYLSFETGDKGRVANEIWWRKPELKGKDKPNTQTVIA